MSHTKGPEREGLPKSGRVNEVCQEWMVREDMALAYRLQNKEFDEHLSGNKYRNQLVREDIPKAKDEQLREQRLAEQAAAIYQKMLAEQEEIDNQLAKDLADKIEREERLKRREIEMRDQDVARQLLEQERHKVERHHHMPNYPPHFSPQKPAYPPPKTESHPSPHRPNSLNYQANLPRRQALAMPLPHEISPVDDVYLDPIRTKEEIESAELYTEPYKPTEKLSDQLNRIDIAEIGVPIDEVTERQIQEERDAALARQLQEQEGSIEETLMNRDRLLAIEAQDKELAKLLQERERAKARRARERAKQKALAKKQQQIDLQQHEHRNVDQLMPDDSYAFPADMIQQTSSVPRTVAAHPDMYAVPNPNDEDVSYSLPVDVLPTGSGDRLRVSHRQNYGSELKEINVVPGGHSSSFEEKISNGLPPQRPTQLDLKSPLTKINKPRYPDPEPCDSFQSTSSTSPTSHQTAHTNIAMAIDPTYSRRGGGGPASSGGSYHRHSSSYDTASSTVTTSTSSSSPGMVLPPPDLGELDDENPAPPYMPIQGQRRTASLEKKQKKKSKDGCKQQ
ncbi:uncharacterized protein LOC109600219 isoform X2 [Aethina tumida]|nr:uncharacterized protein LOC109600219 isoform X2 [Aethina tumida]